MELARALRMLRLVVVTCIWNVLLVTGHGMYIVRWLLNTLRPRQNGRRFADDTFKRIFLNENVRISMKISLKFVPKGPINNVPALIQIMAWRRSGDKPLSEPMMVSLLTHICVTRPQWVDYNSSWRKSRFHTIEHTTFCGGYMYDFVVVMGSISWWFYHQLSAKSCYRLSHIRQCFFHNKAVQSANHVQVLGIYSNLSPPPPPWTKCPPFHIQHFETHFHEWFFFVFWFKFHRSLFYDTEYCGCC